MTEKLRPEDAAKFIIRDIGFDFEAHKEDVARRAAGFKRAYAEAVKRYGMELDCNWGGGLELWDSKNQEDPGITLD